MLSSMVFLIAGFGFKMAVVPFQMWMPDVYEGRRRRSRRSSSVGSKAAAFAVVLRIFFEGLPDAFDQRRLGRDVRRLSPRSR